MGPRLSGPNLLGGMRPSDLSAFRERPLFVQTRRLPASSTLSRAEEVSEPEDREEEPPKIRLAGVLQTSAARIAMLQHGNVRALSRARLGDDINGWVVTAVELASIRLKKGDRGQEYRLSPKGALMIGRQKLDPKADTSDLTKDGRINNGPEGDEDLQAGEGYRLEFSSD